MADENGSKNGGPSWKWLAGVLLGILLTISGSLLAWVAVTVQETSVSVGQLAMQVQEVKGQMAALNAHLDQQDARISQLEGRLATTADTTDNNANWIGAHVLADRAIHRAEQAKHPSR